MRQQQITPKEPLNSPIQPADATGTDPPSSMSSSCQQSRPGTELRGIEGTFQSVISALKPSPLILECSCNRDALWKATWKPPVPLPPVAPIAASAHHSRLGPDGRRGLGVFQPTSAGEFNFDSSHSMPDTASHSSCTPSTSSCTSTIRSTSCLLSTRHQEVNVYYQNIGGMNSVVDDIRVAVSDLCYDIIVLTETWLDSRTLSRQVFGNNYEVFRCDRNAENSRKSTGGGVLVAVNSKFQARTLEDDAYLSLKQVWTAIKLGDRKLFLCALYIPPDRVHERELIVAHCRSVFSVLETAKATDEVMVFGDFNLPRISWREYRDGFFFPDLDHSSIHPNAASLLDCYSSATLTQINHITNQNNRILDLCFVSAQDTAPYLCEAPAPLVKIVPHHPPLLVTINADLKRDLDTASATVSYDFRIADHQSIAEFFSELDWNSILDSVNAENAAQTLSNVLAYAIDRYVPKKIQHPAPRQPWLTRELRQLKSEKRAALKKFTKHRSLSLKRHYVRINHTYKSVAKRCFLRYQQDLQRKLKSHPKQFWKFVNQQRHEEGIPSSMTFNGKEATTSQDICQLFSKKFASVFTDETLSDHHVERAASNTPRSGQALSTIHLDATMISRACSKLKSSLNPGPDGIPSKFLKTQIANLISPLQHVFQLSVTSGIFPSCWKFAYMFPVHKKGKNTM
ncbi:uncharacterized protein LOC129717226 [Wyeomyia smithii]|uniref:uncharacterized protein LOC129717226 n=1 Tax=Wyeomyia smithii TaxID=174621 RepID=UPI002467E01F|nr:uncharacterized protein LOC129717226 [Wyeomyia smithii]